MAMINRALPRKDKYKHKFVDYSPEKDIVSFDVVQKVKKTGESDTDFIVVDELVEVSRVNRQQFYNSQAADHDIYAIIKKVTETGDVGLINNGPKGVYMDVSKLPSNNSELNEKLNNAIKIWEALPDDLKQNMSLGTFVDTMTDDKVNEYLKSKVASAKQTETKDGE